MPRSEVGRVHPLASRGSNDLKLPELAAPAGLSPHRRMSPASNPTILEKLWHTASCPIYILCRCLRTGSVVRVEMSQIVALADAHVGECGGVVWHGGNFLGDELCGSGVMRATGASAAPCGVRKMTRARSFGHVCHGIVDLGWCRVEACHG